MAEFEEPTFETFEEQPMEEAGDAAVVATEYEDDNVIAPAYELPEVKLFGRWSCDDVHVADMSLAVRVFFFFIDLLQTKIHTSTFCLGLHCSQRETCPLHTTFGWPICGQTFPQGTMPDCGTFDKCSDDEGTRQRQEIDGHAHR